MRSWEEIRDNIKSLTDEEKEIIELRVKLTTTQQAYDAIRERLRELEWCNYDREYATLNCPVCDSEKYIGNHVDSCWLGNLLKENNND